MLITSINTTHTQPIARWGSVPLGALSCTTPSAKAAIAAKACSLIAGLAERSGASVTAACESPLVIPGRPKAEPGIPNHSANGLSAVLDSGLAAFAAIRNDAVRLPA
jgi:hypothetical protein